MEQRICVGCNKPIEEGERVAHSPRGPLHEQCAKRGKMQGREISQEELDRILRGE